MPDDRIDYMAIAEFLELNFKEFCEQCCAGDEESAEEQIEALREKANGN